MRTKQVTIYISDDGKEHATEEAALHQDKVGELVDILARTSVTGTVTQRFLSGPARPPRISTLPGWLLENAEWLVPLLTRSVPTPEPAPVEEAPVEEAPVATPPAASPPVSGGARGNPN